MSNPPSLSPSLSRSPSPTNNNNNNSTNSSPSPNLHSGQPTHESIRNLIAANFKPPTRPNPPPIHVNRHDNPLELENHLLQSNKLISNTSSSSTTTSSSRSESPYSIPRNRIKSNSISVGVLSRARATNKKVSFSNLDSGNNSQVFLSSSTSDDSDNEIYSDEDYEVDNEHEHEHHQHQQQGEEEEEEEDEDTSSQGGSSMINQNSGEVLLREPNFTGPKKHHIYSSESPVPLSTNASTLSKSQDQQQEHLDYSHTSILRRNNAKFTAGSMTPSPNTLSPSSSTASLKMKKSKRKPYSIRYNYNQYGGEKLALSKSLDSQLLEPTDSNNSTNSYLPAFNKRPPTDTPIVSTMGSPMTGEQSEDDEDYYDNNHNDDTQRNINSIQEEECDSSNKEEQPIPKLHKTKNISHLNLSELSKEEEQEEKATTKEGGEEKDINKDKNKIQGDTSLTPATLESSPKSRKIAASYAARKIMGEMRRHLLRGRPGQRDHCIPYHQGHHHKFM